MKKELSKIIVGQEKIIESLLRALICKGHVIVEGVPGMAKTLIVRSLGAISGCSVNRIQFTVDLLPTDIIGLTMYREEKGFETVQGPIFANFVIADEINRAPPKTQSALLESMQEKQVTIGKKTYPLPNPFFVMATQNPLEQAGVYTLPEAQVDRFIFKLLVNYPKKKEEKEIMKKNVNLKNFENFGLKKVVSKKDILGMQEKVNKVYLSDEIEDYIVNIVNATRDKNKEYSRYIEWGASPRASINFFIASKAEALMKGRNYVVPDDIKRIALEVLRHRLILNYEAEAENISSDILIKKIINEIPVP
jgi:MoxR-like ATPase